MAKIPTYDALTALAAEDLFYVVDDPSGTPASKKMTAATLSALMKTILNQHFHSWALDLDGTDGLCTLGAAPAITGPAYTFSLWVEMDAVGDIVLGKTADGNAYIYFSDATTLLHKCNVSDVNYVSWVIDSVASGVHHFALRRNGVGNDFDLFQNSILKTPTYSGTLPDNAFTPDLIGDSGIGGFDFNGRVWLLQAWNSALTDAQCQELFTGIAPGSAILDLRFTEGSGTAVKDFSASRNDGTLSGGATWKSRPF